MNHNVLVIIIIILVILVIYLLVRNNNLSDKCIHKKTEYFNNVPGTSSDPNDYNNFGDNDNHNGSNISNLKIDVDKCDISCCGYQKPDIYNGLSPDELKIALASEASNDRSMYAKNAHFTCANGSGGVGCPCLTQNSYKNITNRGQNI